MFETETEERAVRRSPGGDDPRHVPVLADTVVDLLRGLTPGLKSGWIVDATVGLGGHAARILEALPDARLLGIDRDPAALAIAGGTLRDFGARARLRHARHRDLPAVLREEGIHDVSGFLLDLGVSSLQLDEAERGFSFQSDGPLDMRMDPASDRTAADIVNGWDEHDLADLFYYEGGETRGRVAARAIVESRRRAPFLRTAALADCVAHAFGRGGEGRLHPATKVFQALRRAVNQEGDELAAALVCAQRALAPAGRLIVISFHSGEDGEVKRFLAAGARAGRFELLAKKPIEAGPAERRANPRSRSAKLRAALKLGENGAEKPR